MRKIIIIISSIILTSLLLLVPVSAVDNAPDTVLVPAFCGYTVQNGNYYPYSWDGDEFLIVTNDNVTTNPVTYFNSYSIQPTLANGYVYRIMLQFYTAVDGASASVIDTPQSLYSVLFFNGNFTKYYEFPKDNIVVTSFIRQGSNVRTVLYDVDIYLYCDEYVNIDEYLKCPFLTIEFPNIEPNAKKIRLVSSNVTVKTGYTRDEFQSYVADSMAGIQTGLNGINDSVMIGTEKTQTAIQHMPANEYDWINGEFGKQAETPANEFVNDVVNNQLNVIVEKLSPSLQSLYDSVSSHDATFSIVVPNSQVPFFKDLSILPNNVNGRIYLYDYLSPEVVSKFNDVLPVVRGFTSIGAIIGLIYWVLPKNMIGANRGD